MAVSGKAAMSGESSPSPLNGKVPCRLVRLDRRHGLFEIAFVLRLGLFQPLGAQPEVRILAGGAHHRIGNTALPSCVRPPR